MSKLNKVLLVFLVWLVIAIVTGVIYSNIKVDKFDYNYFLKGISIYSVGAIVVLAYLIYKIIKEEK